MGCVILCDDLVYRVYQEYLVILNGSLLSNGNYDVNDQYGLTRRSRKEGIRSRSGG